MKILTCAYCGIEFEDYRGNIKYCPCHRWNWNRDIKDIKDVLKWQEQQKIENDERLRKIEISRKKGEERQKLLNLFEQEDEEFRKAKLEIETEIDVLRVRENAIYKEIAFLRKRLEDYRFSKFDKWLEKKGIKE